MGARGGREDYGKRVARRSERSENERRMRVGVSLPARRNMMKRKIIWKRPRASERKRERGGGSKGGEGEGKRIERGAGCHDNRYVTTLPVGKIAGKERGGGRAKRGRGIQGGT